MDWFKKQEYEGLYTVPEHYLEEYYDIDWDSNIRNFYSLEEWENLMWEEQMEVISMIAYEEILIDEYPPSTKIFKTENSSFEKFSVLLPSFFREEYIGELLEGRALLEKKGLPKWWVSIITIWNFLNFLRISRLQQLRSLIASIFESIKRLIS